MDEKWDVFTEDDVVFLHRSWTGFEIFEAAFVPAEGGGWVIAGAMVESDPERYGGTSDMRSSLTLELVLSAIVLGEDATDLRTRLVEAAAPTPSSGYSAPPSLRSASSVRRFTVHSSIDTAPTDP